MLDVDGTLAPRSSPGRSSLVCRTRRGPSLRRLVARYALVACISGRTGADARKIVGVDGPVYVGVHGLELAPEAERWRGPLREFAESVDWPVEDKGLAVVFHYRGAVDEEAALGTLRGVADRATALRASGPVRAQGARGAALRLRPTRERPCGRCSSSAGCGGRSTRAMTRPTSTPSAALDGLDVSVRIAVASAEGPPELREAADIVVESLGRAGRAASPPLDAEALAQRARLAPGDVELGLLPIVEHEPEPVGTHSADRGDLAEVDEVAAVDPRKASRG